ncbi:MAG: glycosyltransferase [Frankiaceae bacterium]
MAGEADPAALRVVLITLGDPGRLTGGYLYHRRVAALAPEFGAAVEFVSVPQRAFPLPALAGRGVLAAAARARPHVLLLDSIAAGYLAPWLGRVRPPAPLAAILHQPPGGIDGQRWRVLLQTRLDLHAYRYARLLVAASQDLADQVGTQIRPGQRLVVVAPGRDADAGVAPASGEEAGGGSGPAGPADRPEQLDLRRGRLAALLCVGNWVAHKGVLDLLDAVAQLPGETVTLHLVGDPHADPVYAGRVLARLDRPDVAGRVVVHGAVPAGATCGFYRAADVFVLASRRESYGTVYGEAMAAGLPVVGWAAGNLPHLARDGEEGIVVPTGDHRALSAALRRLSLDEPLRRRMGAAARRRALTFPTWRESTEQLFACLRAAAADV